MHEALADGTGEKPTEPVMAVAADDDETRGVFVCRIGELVGRVTSSRFERPRDIRSVENGRTVPSADFRERVFGLDQCASARADRRASRCDRRGVLDVHHNDATSGGMGEVDRSEQRCV
jgi:hypothetical protein